MEIHEASSGEADGKRRTAKRLANKITRHTTDKIVQRVARQDKMKKKYSS